MPLNDLLHHHQLSLMRAAAAPSDGGRRTQLASVADYADRIAALGVRDGATAAPLVRA